MSGYVWQGNRQILFGPRKSIAESDPGTSVAIGVKLGNRSFLSLGNFICYTLGTPFDLTEPMSRKHRYFTGLLWAQRVGHFWKNCMKIILEPSCDAWWQGEKWRGCRDSDITSTRVSCMEIIKIRGIMKEFGEGKRFPDFTQHWSGRLKQVNLQT